MHISIDFHVKLIDPIGYFETKAVRQFDAVVAATPHIAEQFEGRAKKIVVINNYPLLDVLFFKQSLSPNENVLFVMREELMSYGEKK